MAREHERTKNKILSDFADGLVYNLLDNKQAFGETESGFKSQFGLGAGTSDLIGYASPNGKFVAIEIKTPASPKLTAKQKAFLLHVRRCGGYALVAMQEYSERGYRMFDVLDYVKEKVDVIH